MMRETIMVFSETDDSRFELIGLEAIVVVFLVRPTIRASS
jgi:hypothetical protein